MKMGTLVEEKEVSLDDAVLAQVVPGFFIDNLSDDLHFSRSGSGNVINRRN
jgi:hypothetical protein